ncbi:MAG: GNAT family N-acetyltransferase [Defluviitaleaceae bacterium]|nr:GNAT family N-acetyltransferase [Defluviitaleaceae bacterium]MCL2835241.1 GNAT family N-acetyltransferase [Defluviitaleaceae bacterium]
MITLQRISEDNLEDVLKLRASEKLVAPNSYSLAEAYCCLQAIANGEIPPKFALMPFAIAKGEIIVGFAMIGFEDGGDVYSDGSIYWISRLMIDEQHQGKGYGKAAMAALINLVKTKPNNCEAKYIYTSYVPENNIAAKTYAGFGFIKTEQVLDGEDVVRLVF